ncbi:MAG: LppA family lipoprotein [Thermocrispum sp.]
MTLGLLISGCLISDPDRTSMTAQEQFAELMTRPDVQQAKDRYEAMQATIRAELTDRLDLPKWTTDPETANDRPCGDFPDVHPFDLGTFSLALWSTQGPLDDHQWSQAKQTLREVSRDYGFTHVAMEANRAASPVYQLSDGDGANLHLMVNPQNRVVLQVNGGCHLKPESKERGRPINEEEKESYRRKPNAAPAAEPTPSEPAREVQPARGVVPDLVEPDRHRWLPEPDPQPSPKPQARTRQPDDDDDADYDDINFLR